jgi:hypothetical protein
MGEQSDLDVVDLALSSDPDRDTRVVEDQPEPVVGENRTETERRREVFVTRALAVVREAGVALFQSFDAKSRRAHVGSGCVGPFADAQAEPVHRQGVRAGRGLEIDVQATPSCGAALPSTRHMPRPSRSSRTSWAPEADCPTTCAQRVTQS